HRAIAIVGRGSADRGCEHRPGDGSAETTTAVGVEPRWGWGLPWSPRPRVRLRRPWALAWNPFRVRGRRAPVPPIRERIRTGCCPGSDSPRVSPDPAHRATAGLLA